MGPHPDEDDLRRAADMRPERAIQLVFLWTQDCGETRDLAFEFFELYSAELRDYEFQPAAGSQHWLSLLKQYSVPCCACSSFDRHATELALERAGLSDLFQDLVTSEDGCDTPEQSYLLACVKLKRPPQQCVCVIIGSFALTFKSVVNLR